MKLPKLRRKLRKQAKSEYRKGNIDREKYLLCLDLSNYDAALAQFNNKIEKEVNPWNRADGLIGASWSEWFANLWDWFVANWPTILKIIITIAPLLLLEPQRDNQ